MLYIDSADADAYIETQTNTNSQTYTRPLTTNFIFALREKLVVPDHEDCLVSLHSATIPYSFYNVRAGINDIIPVKFTFGTGATLITKITIDDGNYDVYNLASSIANGTTRTKTTDGLGFNLTTGMDGFNTIDISSLAIMGGNILSDIATITITYDRVNMGYEFKWTATGGAPTTLTKCELLFSSNPNNEVGFANNLLGLVLQDYPVAGDWKPIATSTFTNFNTITSNQVVDLLDNIHGLYLRQNLVSKSTLDSSGGGTFTNILERIPINTTSGGIIFYSPSNPHRSLVNIKEVDTIGIKLTDDRNRAIDLNGLNFQIGILIQFIPQGLRRITNPSREMINNDLASRQSLKISGSKKPSKKKN
tara:strand:+ start:325 stop:1413 length:1089 start_codon:yes stop_codon:yes gene_type:complete